MLSVNSSFSEHIIEPTERGIATSSIFVRKNVLKISMIAV